MLQRLLNTVLWSFLVFSSAQRQIHRQYILQKYQSLLHTPFLCYTRDDNTAGYGRTGNSRAARSTLII